MGIFHSKIAPAAIKAPEQLLNNQLQDPRSPTVNINRSPIGIAEVGFCLVSITWIDVLMLVVFASDPRKTNHHKGSRPHGGSNGNPGQHPNPDPSRKRRQFQAAVPAGSPLAQLIRSHPADFVLGRWPARRKQRVQRWPLWDVARVRGNQLRRGHLQRGGRRRHRNSQFVQRH